MTNDMTKGSPLGLMIRFMIPVCLGNLFQQLYNLADSVIAGNFIGVNALAAIGSTGSLIFFVTGWMNGLTSGFAILISQSFGAGNEKKLRHYLAMSIYLTAGMAAVMTILLLMMNVSILHLMNAPAELMDDISAYMGIIYAGLAVTAAYNAFAAILRAIGDSKSPLYFLIISAAINVGFDILFIIRFGMGVRGCAYATVIAQGISALLCLVYMIRKFPLLRLKKEDCYFNVHDMKRMMMLGVPMGLQFSITAIGTIIVQSAINVYGPINMAGFAAAGKIQNIVTIVFVALGATIATFVGQNRGAGRMDRVKEGVKIAQILTVVLSFAAMVIVLAVGTPLCRLFTGQADDGVLKAASIYFKTVAWCYPLLASIFIYRNALQGLGYGLVPMLGGVFELLARYLAVMFLAGRVGYQGVCFADPAAWIFALIPIVPYYYLVIKKMKTE